jgi:hypothetical protein
MKLFHVILIHASFESRVNVHADSHERAFVKAMQSLKLTYEQVDSAVIKPLDVKL